MKRKEALSQDTSLVSGQRGQGKDVALKPAEVQLVKNRHCEIDLDASSMVAVAPDHEQRKGEHASRTPT